MPFPARGGGQTSLAKADGEDITTNYTFKRNLNITPITQQLNIYVRETTSRTCSLNYCMYSSKSNLVIKQTETPIYIVMYIL